jgi:hypothetical protein
MGGLQIQVVQESGVGLGHIPGQVLDLGFYLFVFFEAAL